MIPSDVRSRLVESPPSDLDACVEMVLIAEGFESADQCDLALRRQVRNAMRNYVEREGDFLADQYARGQISEDQYRTRRDALPH